VIGVIAMTDQSARARLAQDPARSPPRPLGLLAQPGEAAVGQLAELLHALDLHHSGFRPGRTGERFAWRACAALRTAAGRCQTRGAFPPDAPRDLGGPRSPSSAVLAAVRSGKPATPP
jgi:hypothetical protein